MGSAMGNERGGRSGSRTAKNAGWATAVPLPTPYIFALVGSIVWRGGLPLWVNAPGMHPLRCVVVIVIREVCSRLGLDRTPFSSGEVIKIHQR